MMFGLLFFRLYLDVTFCFYFKISRPYLHNAIKIVDLLIFQLIWTVQNKGKIVNAIQPKGRIIVGKLTLHTTLVMAEGHFWPAYFLQNNLLSFQKRDTKTNHYILLTKVSIKRCVDLVRTDVFWGGGKNSNRRSTLQTLIKYYSCHGRIYT